MPIHVSWKKAITGALAVTLITSSSAAVLATEPVAVYADSSYASAAAKKATQFTDVQAGNWAEKYIAKLSLQKIVQGYYDQGTDTYRFQPEKDISQQEAIVMAVRFAGLQDKLSYYTGTEFPEDFDVNTYAKAYVELAFEEGLLDREQEYENNKVESDKGWGYRQATREWVTKLIVKAVDQEAVAKQLANTPSNFDDANLMDDKYLGYINAATQLGLIVGIVQNDKENLFGPDRPIKRASLATLFSRAQSHIDVEYEGQASGIITELKDNKLVLYVNGVEKTYYLDDNTAFYRYTSGEAASRADLVEFGDVMLIAEQDTIKYIEVMSDEKHVSQTTGSIVHYNETEKILYVLTEGKPEGIPVSETTVIEDTDGKNIPLADLKRDSNVTILMDTFREKPSALKIVVSVAPAVSTMEGMLYRVDRNHIVIKTDNSNVDGLVTKYLASDVKVEITGIPNAQIEDLMNDVDRVVIGLNNEGYVSSIKVLSKEVKTAAGVQAYYNKNTDKFITISDAAGNQGKVLYFTDRTKYDYMGTAIDRSAAIGFMNQNMNMIVKYSDDKLISIQFVLSFEGTVIERNTTDKTITLMLDEGVEVTLPYGNAGVFIANKPASTIVNVSRGDNVLVRLQMNKLEASAILVQTVDQYEIVSIDGGLKRITIKNSKSGTINVLVGDSEILSPNGLKQTFLQLKVGMQVEVTLLGDQLKKLQVK